MICHIEAVEFGLNGAEITFTTSDRAAVGAAWDELHDCDIDLSCKRRRDKRSLSANAMLWQLIGQLSFELCLGKDEVYRSLIREAGIYTAMTVTSDAVDSLKRLWEANGVGWQVEVVGTDREEGYTDLLLYSGSSAYNTKEFSRLVDAVIQDCEAIGIEVESERLRSLIEDEEKKHYDRPS